MARSLRASAWRSSSRDPSRDALNVPAWRPGLMSAGLTAITAAFLAAPDRAAAGEALPYVVAIFAGSVAGTATGRRSAIVGAAAGTLIGVSTRLALVGWVPGEPLTPTPLAFLLHRLGASTTALPRAMLGLALIAAVGAAVGVVWRQRGSA